jgi:hypothetical protein
MDFSLPGQLRGPECGRVMRQAIELRRALEPWFQTLSCDRVAKLTVVLRVDGSLGSFGPQGVENIELDRGHLHCDLVLSDAGWETRSDRQIHEILRNQVINAIDACFRHSGIAHETSKLDKFVGTVA